MPGLRRRGVRTGSRQSYDEDVLGPVQATADIVYLRPETAQGIFVNFENVLNSTRKRLPFGIAQIGKSFRNEITPGNFTFRTREFEQMEMEYFVMPDEADSSLQYWVEQRFQWYLDLGIRPENLRLRWHDPDELAHYAKATADVEYLFPMGWSELEGIANRTDFDLLQHSKTSGKSLTVFDEEAKQHVTPTSSSHLGAWTAPPSPSSSIPTERKRYAARPESS